MSLEVDNTDDVFNDAISEEQLIKISGQNNLLNVVTISLLVNTQHQSILSLGDNLVNLTTLVLDKSVISSIRDLGTGLKKLETLSLNDCSLSELDGIGMITTLRHLSVQDNQISEVAPLALHENIKVLFFKFNHLIYFIC